MDLDEYGDFVRKIMPVAKEDQGLLDDQVIILSDELAGRTVMGCEPNELDSLVAEHDEALLDDQAINIQEMDEEVQASVASTDRPIPEERLTRCSLCQAEHSIAEVCPA